MEKILLESEKYAGKYVAFRSRDDNTVVGAGDTPEEALRVADEVGCTTPILFYVPEKQSVHIY
jgi:hypothetical protein